MSDTDLELLARYARQRAEGAFAELVRRYLGLVYSAALRQVRSPQLAEEVTQSAFIKLAHHATKLKPDTILTAWLYQVTRRAAIDVVRREASRQLREQIATEINALNATAANWAGIEPLLDEAMHALDETDRAAVLLRYFENKSLREVGTTFGVSENAAQKRLGRAIEQLREFFSKRGVTVRASGLVVGMSANAVQAAPLGLAATLTNASLAATGGTTFAALKLMSIGKIQASITALVIIGVATTFVLQRQSQGNLRDQNERLRQQVAQLSSENDDLSDQITKARKSYSLGSDRLRELLRLRGEVGVLRHQQRQLEHAIAAALTNTPALAGQPAFAAVAQTNQSAPFQLHLVLDEPEANSAILTNTTGVEHETLYVHKTPLMDYAAIRSATVTKDSILGTPHIDVEFSEEGKELFAQITKENINKRLAVVLDGDLYSAPVIRAEVSDGKAQITGSFTEEAARILAAKINEMIKGN